MFLCVPDFFLFKVTGKRHQPRQHDKRAARCKERDCVLDRHGVFFFFHTRETRNHSCVFRTNSQSLSVPPSNLPKGFHRICLRGNPG